MAKQSKRFSCSHGIYAYEFSRYANKYLKKPIPEVTVTIGGVAYYHGDGETDFDIDQIIFVSNGIPADVTELMKALDCMEEFNDTAKKEADLIYANECASEDEPDDVFEMIANYTHPCQP